jgi:hypothetical protein
MNRFIKTEDNELVKFPYKISSKIIDKYIIMKRDENVNFLSLYL